MRYNPTTKMECFNCFQQGFCEYGVRSSSGKVLRFCSDACAFVQQTENAILVATHSLNVANDAFDRLKTREKQDQFTVPSKKILFTLRLFLNSLIAQKSKTELIRISDIVKDQLCDMLTLVGDTSTENNMLIFAKRMKEFHEEGLKLIQILGK